MKKVILLLLSVFIAGCEQPSYNNVKDEFLLPPELADCAIYILRGSTRSIYAVRCDGRSTLTTTLSGKYKNPTVVID